DVSGDQTRVGQNRWQVWIITVKAYCEIDVAASISPNRSCDLLGKRIRLTAVNRITHVRIVSGTAGTQIEVPEIDPGRHTANRRRVVITYLVGAVAGLTVTACHRCLHGHVGAERDAAFNVVCFATRRLWSNTGSASERIARRYGEENQAHEIDARAGRTGIDAAGFLRTRRAVSILRHDWSLTGSIRRTVVAFMNDEIVVVGGIGPVDCDIYYFARPIFLGAG